MANTIKLKQGSGSDPSASDLVLGEPAVRTDTAELFLKKDDGTVAKLSGGGLSDGDKGDITVSNSAATFTIDSGVIDNANIASNAAIAGTKIDPDFGSQNIETSGNITSPVLVAQGASGSGDGIILLNSGGGTNADFARIRQVLSDDSFVIENKATGSYVSRFSIASDGTVTIPNNLDCSAGIDVTGTTTGTVSSANAQILKLVANMGTNNNRTLNFNSPTTDSGSEPFVISTGNALQVDIDSQKTLFIDHSGQINLHHDGSTDAKLSTSSSGIDVTGGITSTGDITITNTSPQIFLVDSNNNSDYEVANEDGTFRIRDTTNSANRLTIDSSGTTEVTGTFAINSSQPTIQLNDSDANDDFAIRNVDGVFGIRDITNGANRLTINSSGTVNIAGNVDFGAGIDVTGQITATDTISTTGNLDMSDSSGTGNNRIRLGNDDDLEIYHDGSNSRISDSGTGMLILQTSTLTVSNAANSELMISAEEDGAVKLYFNHSKKLETKTDGVDVIGELQCDSLDVDGSAEFSGADATFFGANYNAFWDHSASQFQIEDNAKIVYGSSQDLQIYHDGSNSRIVDSGTGNLNIDSSAVVIRSANAADNLAKFIQNGACELYHNGSKKLNTNSGGVDISGHAYFADNNGTRFGAGEDFRIYHDGSTNLIVTEGPNIKIGTTGETFALFKNNNAVELYYDNSKKAETVSGGFTVSGTCTATTFSGSGANLTNLPSPTVENAAFAWINFSSTTNSIRGSYNVSSISDHGTGNFSVNFTNNASNNNYAVQINGTQTTSNTAISFLLSHSGPNLNSNTYSDSNFSTSAFRWVMGYGPSSVSMDSKLVCATVHES